MIPENRDFMGSVREEFISTEPVKSARYFARIAPILVGYKNTEIFVSLYQYARIIDNEVDEGNYPSVMRTVIRSDLNLMNNLLNQQTPDFMDPSQIVEGENVEKFIKRRQLLKHGLALLEESKHAKVLRSLQEALKGTYLDNVSMMFGRPLPDCVKEYRDERMILVYFDALAEVFFNKPFVNEKHRNNMRDFFEWAIRFDAIDDFAKDFVAGQFVFSRKSIQEAGLELYRGVELDEQFKQYYIHQRVKVSKEGRTVARIIFESNMPLIANMFIYVWLLGQSYRIGNKRIGKQKQVYFGVHDKKD